MIHQSESLFVRVEATVDLLQAIEKLLAANALFSHGERCEILALRLQLLLAQHRAARSRARSHA